METAGAPGEERVIMSTAQSNTSPQRQHLTYSTKAQLDWMEAEKRWTGEGEDKLCQKQGGKASEYPICPSATSAHKRADEGLPALHGENQHCHALY